MGAADMDGLSSFVNRIDFALSMLTDERAVLKNFEWPEAKYDTMREATASHMELLAVKNNCQNWQCGAEPCEVECSKISAFRQGPAENREVRDRPGRVFGEVQGARRAVGPPDHPGHEGRHAGTV